MPCFANFVRTLSNSRKTYEGIIKTECYFHSVFSNSASTLPYLIPSSTCTLFLIMIQSSIYGLLRKGEFSVDNNSYVFISYAHKDSAIVLPCIEAMKKKGVNLWYDEGIAAGSE